MRKSYKNAIKLLTSAALVLPGIQAKAEAPPPIPHAEFRYSTYDETGVRYDINVYQALLEIPIQNKILVSLLTQRDLQTGASFVFAAPQRLAEGQGSGAIVVPVTTQASIRENRESMDLTGSYYFPKSIASLGVGYSTEDDYVSKSVNVQWRRLFKKKTRELALGFGYSADEVMPTLDGVPTHLPRESIESEGHIASLKFVAGLRQDFTPKTTGKFTFSYEDESGYLADPYKRVSIYGNATALRPGSVFLPGFFFGGQLPAGITVDYDRRPGTRYKQGYEATLIHYLDKANSSVHLQYAYAQDTWGIHSNEIELKYFQPFSGTWLVAPLIRYYTQQQASFYAYIFNVAPNHPPFIASQLPDSLESSCDYRLAKFGTLNAQLMLSKRFIRDIELSFTGGVYLSREWLHWGHSPEVSNPFTHYTATYLAINTAIDFG